MRDGHLNNHLRSEQQRDRQTDKPNKSIPRTEMTHIRPVREWCQTINPIDTVQ